MSRAFNLAMNENDVLRHCHDRKIAISALEVLPGGTVRLVCSSSEGAVKVRASLGRYLVDGHVRQELFRPRPPLW
jgi:hypothetical protein